MWWLHCTHNGETRQGLASILTGQCSVCKHSIVLETSPKVKDPQMYCRWECNLAAVWGQMATGGGHSHLEETMSVLGVLVMTQASFIRVTLGSGGRRNLQNPWSRQERKKSSWLRREVHNNHEGKKRGNYSILVCATNSALPVHGTYHYKSTQVLQKLELIFLRNGN